MGNTAHWLLQPDLNPLLHNGQGVFLLVIAAIVFAESGLLLGFFLPGDSLLFSAGLVAAIAGKPNPILLAGAVFVAAVAGDQVGYAIGRRAGPPLYTRPDGRIYRREYLSRSSEFFARHGGRAVVLARFVPIVRTFTPVVAGISRMPYRLFVTYNIAGGFGWAVVVSMLGFILGRRFPGLEHVLTPVILGIVLLSVSPALLHLWRARHARKKAEESNANV